MIKKIKMLADEFKKSYENLLNSLNDKQKLLLQETEKAEDVYKYWLRKESEVLK